MVLTETEFAAWKGAENSQADFCWIGVIHFNPLAYHQSHPESRALIHNPLNKAWAGLPDSFLPGKPPDELLGGGGRALIRGKHQLGGERFDQQIQAWTGWEGTKTSPLVIKVIAGATTGGINSCDFFPGPTLHIGRVFWSILGLLYFFGVL